jgi:CBASS immunity sensor of nucleotide second messenger signals/HNH endonuclease
VDGRRGSSAEKEEALTMSNMSPIQSARNIPLKTKVVLWVRAGGRCEFDDCNEYLLKHHVTLDELNLGEFAHIVAFRPEGPRGEDSQRPVDIHDVSNLMLLCPRCHKLIDDPGTKEKFTKVTLARHKREHEERIFRLTAAKPERKTTVVQLLAKVGGQPVSIPRADIWDAVAPMYPADDKGCIIDLSTLDDGSDSYYSVAMDKIARSVDNLYDPGLHTDAPRHISLFALAPMPLLMFLGHHLSNKTPVDLYQRHRDTQTWTWRTSGPRVQYLLRRIREGTTRDRVALLLSLSATLDVDKLPAHIDSTYTIYEITLEGQLPTPLFLTQRQDLEAFRSIYHQILAEILRDHGSISSIDVFPAVPAPIAVLCGFEVFPKVSPRIRVFDNDNRRGGWSFILEIL